MSPHPGGRGGQYDSNDLKPCGGGGGAPDPGGTGGGAGITHPGGGGAGGAGAPDPGSTGSRWGWRIEVTFQVDVGNLQFATINS